MEEKYLIELLKLAYKAAKKNEIPISALIVNKNKVIAKAYNTRNKKNITTDHAEILAIQRANKKLKSWRLNNCSLYVTIEPCDMCKNVIRESRIDEVYYLLPRLEYKKIYNKTKFYQINNNPKINEIYTIIKDNFWKNIR